MFVKPLLLASLAMVGTATGSLIEDHAIDVKTVAAVGAMAVPLVWTLSHRLTRIEDRLDSHEKLMRGLRCVRDKGNCSED